MAAMEPPKNPVREIVAGTSQDVHPIAHTTQQGQENNEQLAASAVSKDSLEPKTGDHIMESRIPEESATMLTPHQSFPSMSSKDSSSSSSSSTHHQSFPVAKRQRMATDREYLNQRAQQLIDEVNDKRKADTMLLADFKKAMEMQVATSYGILEQSMYQMYERNGKIMQAKLQELFATLDRIAKLEAELQQFKQALGALYSDIQHPS